MSRARNIKPGFYKNEDLAECSVWARLLFPGLWMLADREGRLEDRPRRIKGEIFPFDSVEVGPLLDELTTWGFIRRYVVGGRGFIQVLGFLSHQNPHGTEKDSAIPDEAGFLNVNERSKTNCITGKFRQIPFVSTPASVNIQTANVNPPLSNVNLPSHNALNPESLNPESSSQVRNEPAAAAPREDSPPPESESAPKGTRAGELCLILRPLGVAATPGHPVVREWAAGLAVSDDEARETVARAREYKPLPTQIPMAYLGPILASLRSEPARPQGGAPPRRGGKQAARDAYNADASAAGQRLGLDDEPGDTHASPSERDITDESARIA